MLDENIEEIKTPKNHKRMIIIISTIIALVIIFGFFFKTLTNDPGELPSQLLGKPIPEFTAKKLSEPGAIAPIISNEDIKGPALLNVWATWCPTCKEEHETLNELKAKKGINIYGINYKDDSKLAYEWLEDLGNPYLFNYLDNSGRIGIELGVYGAPETFFIDENNIIRYRYVGAILPEIWENELSTIYESTLLPIKEVE